MRTTTTTPELAEHVIATLRAHEAELRQAGIHRLSLFGSVARGDAEAESDVDLAVEFDPAGRSRASNRKDPWPSRRNPPRAGREPTAAGQRRARPPDCLLGTTQRTASTITPDLLRMAANAADEAARETRPRITAGMTTTDITKQTRRFKPHSGTAVAAVMRQLARDIEKGRPASIGVEWDAEVRATTEQGGVKVCHPLIRWHGLAEALAIPANARLLLIDADANLEINRRLFGPDLPEVRINALRQTFTIQISDAVLGNSSLAPAKTLPNNCDKAGRLRGRLAAMVGREVANVGGGVLILTTLPVRRALTGETDALLPVSVAWQGAEITPYGRHLGRNDWSDFKTVVLIGREQLPAIAAERIARAIYADAPNVGLTLTGSYQKEERRHDTRCGVPKVVKVWAHPDPRVQAILEIKRECAMGQGIDRIRPVRRHPANPARVMVACNLPVPGLVVDELIALEDLLQGGSTLQLALRQVSGGVLPLVPSVLRSMFAKLFTSERTARRAVEAINGQSAYIDSYCRLAIYRVVGQKRASKALIRSDSTEPKRVLERLLDRAVVEFRLLKPELQSAERVDVPEQPRAVPGVEGCGVGL